MLKSLEDYLKKSSDDESVPYFHIKEDDFTILPLLILSSYLKGIEEISIKFEKGPSINQFDKISSIVSKLPGLEITYITIKEIFLKYIASHEDLDLSKVDRSWIKLLLETSEFILQHANKKTSKKEEAYYHQYRKRAEKLFLKRKLKGHSKFFVKLILENILNIFNEVWASLQEVDTT